MTEPSAVDLSNADQRRDIVRSVWQDVLEIAEVDDDSTFFDMGGDSLRLAVLVEKLNQRTGLSLRTVDLFRAHGPGVVPA
ncbi:acyl carrier protein [Micromonospora sp. NPDC050695]|uniref:acyl carrier protein n=1 Tax=Micromonospora sp. NPDC050695 TaxID=3154938 RepID=UPI0033DA581A